MSRKKKRKPTPAKGKAAASQKKDQQKPLAAERGNAEEKAEQQRLETLAEEKKSAAADYRELQKAWQEERDRQAAADEAKEKARREEEERKKAEAEEHERVTGLLEEAKSQEEVLELDVSIDVWDLYRFNLYNTFHSSSGILALIGAVMVALVAFFTTGRIGLVYTVIYYLCAAVFLFYYPLIGYLQARVQLQRSLVLSHALHYTFQDSGIDVLSRAVEEDNEAVLDWDDILKAVETGSELFIYTGKTDGYILPKRVVSAKMPKIRKKLRAGLPHEILRLRGGRRAGA